MKKDRIVEWGLGISLYHFRIGCCGTLAWHQLRTTIVVVLDYDGYTRRIWTQRRLSWRSVSNDLRYICKLN